MNRIILIGNGFDLAHGMKTSYQNFLNDYWENVIKEINKEGYVSSYENEEIRIDRVLGNYIQGNTYNDLINALPTFKSEIKYHNRFLEALSKKTYIENWVDVENEYYELLIKSFDRKKFPKHVYFVNELNEDFDVIKKKLGIYLGKVERESKSKSTDRYNITRRRSIGNKIYSPFKLKDFSESFLNQKTELQYNILENEIEALKSREITMQYLSEANREIVSIIGLDKPKKKLKELLQSDEAYRHFDLIPNQTLFLNFNYTSTNNYYEDPKDFKSFNKEKSTQVSTIHIHGSLEQIEDNPMIFGFGDEIDEDYKRIERLNDNKYLENIKSINYLETDNYKKLLEFVNGGNYQIFTFGHSCGLSDRTMLNTIFEHKNCASIKIYYHKRTNDNDNFSDIIRNLSRNFNDKAIMRDRVVNKTYCEPL